MKKSGSARFSMSWMAFILNHDACIGGLYPNAIPIPIPSSWYPMSPKSLPPLSRLTSLRGAGPIPAWLVDLSTLELPPVAATTAAAAALAVEYPA